MQRKLHDLVRCALHNVVLRRVLDLGRRRVVGVRGPAADGEQSNGCADDQGAPRGLADEQCADEDGGGGLLQADGRGCGEAGDGRNQQRTLADADVVRENFNQIDEEKS